MTLYHFALICRKTCSLFFLLLSFQLGIAQKAEQPSGKASISGIVRDSSSNDKIEYATLTLLMDSSSKVVNGSLSNAKGAFSITALPEGNYQLRVEFVGYRAKIIHDIRITEKNQSVNIGNILLAKTAAMLKEVTVTAKSPLVETKIDKLVYNAEKDITSQGGVATDVLRKVPEVTIDVDGNVQLQGSSSIRFLINGKPSTMFGNSVSDALQSIPASQIKSIEVITSPGAKYDAEGTGGIINIILKTNRLQGINGNVNVSAGTRLENGSLNLNARKGNFGAHAFFSGNAKLPSTTLTGLDRLSADTLAKTSTHLIQDGSSSLLRNGFQSSAGFDWNPGKRDNISGSVSLDNFNFGINGYSNQQQLTTLDSTGGTLEPPAFLVNHPDNKFHFQELGLELNYKKTFAKEDEELEFSFQSNSGKTSSRVNQYQTPLPGDSILSGTRSTNPGTQKETVINVDFTNPLSEKIKLETGAKVTFQRIQGNTDAYSYQPSSAAYVYDNYLSNSLTYSRNIYAAYASLAFPLMKIVDVKIGTRYERTENSASFSNQPVPNLPGYNTLVPSFYLSRKLNERNTIKFTYTKRIERPDYRELNPFINTSDPKNLSTGNPYLQPEVGERYEIGYNRTFENDGAFTVSLFLRANKEDIQPYVVYYPSLVVGDSTYYNVSLSTPQNIGLEDMTGLSLYGSYPVTPKFTLRSNLSFFNKHINNRFIPGSAADSYNYRVNLNGTYQFNKTFFAEFFGNFNSARNEVQGKYPSFTTYSLAFKKQIWHQKGSIGFTTTNPFNEYVTQRTELTGQQFIVNSYRKIAYRSFGISFTYKFGKLEFKKEREKDNQDNNGGPGAEN